MRYLRPIVLKETMWSGIEATINDIFEKTIFDPIRAAFRALNLNMEILNAAPAIGLERALRDGSVYYDDGRIYGRFNASISKELKGMGATFDKRTSSWKLPIGSALSARLQMAVADAESRARQAVDAVIRVVDNIDLGKNVDIEQLREQYGTAAFRMNADFIATTQAVAIAPEFTAATAKIIADGWANNLDLYIKGWMKDSILDLRQKVLANSLRGQRAENLVKTIQATYGASKTKAKFLARQETSLLMSKMRETRYKDIGIGRYKWTGVNDARERPDHKMLNGTIHNWNTPPITNRETGARNHPGEDFGCRCTAVPLLPGEEE